jgi:hypothetical protein
MHAIHSLQSKERLSETSRIVVDSVQPDRYYLRVAESRLDETSIPIIGLPTIVQ